MKLNSGWKFMAWGHSDEHGSTHTHRYIHSAFKKAFASMGYDSYCKPDLYDNNFDYSKTIFLTEWQEASQLPIRDDCFYILHNCNGGKYEMLYESKRAIRYAVYKESEVVGEDFVKKDKCTYHNVSLNTLAIPWATDLLPDEIERNKPGNICNLHIANINWVGTIGAGVGGNIDKLQPFINAAKENLITFSKFESLSDCESIEKIKKSWAAPVISGAVQCSTKYIPCRLFKNISYGMFPLVNHEGMNELFDNKLIYNQDTYQLFYDAKEKLPQITLEQMHDLMDEVKNKHTYLNRIDSILEFSALVNPNLIGDMLDL